MALTLDWAEETGACFCVKIMVKGVFGSHPSREIAIEGTLWAISLLFCDHFQLQNGSYLKQVLLYLRQERLKQSRTDFVCPVYRCRRKLSYFTKCKVRKLYMDITANIICSSISNSSAGRETCTCGLTEMLL